MAKIIGVKFKNTAKVYYFGVGNDKVGYPEKSGVIVETSKGLEYGTVAFGVKDIPDEKILYPLKPVIRKANEHDEKIRAESEAKIPEAMNIATEKIAEHGLKMKLVGCEYSFDGKKAVFYFTADNRIDFRELVKDLAARLHTRIELRQLGIRDETKLLGGIAPCGRTCCCASCGADFGKVSIKMAKNQGLHLNPSKISGLCGRLMCCLEYENEYYEGACKKMPKMGGTVKTPEGNGVVIANDMLKLISKVKITKEDGSEVYKDFPVSELEFKKQQCKCEEDNGGDDVVSEDVEKILD